MSDLEARVRYLEQFIETYFRIRTVNDPAYVEPQTGLMEIGRRGQNSDYWLINPVADGALRSAGNSSCWVGNYMENEGKQVSTKYPSTATYSASLTDGPMPNIGIHAIAGGSPDKKGISQNYCGLFTSGNREMSIQYEGFQLFGPWNRVLMGPAGGPYTELWPKPGPYIP